MKNPLLAIEAASKAAPHEACGVTVGGVAIELENISQNPVRSFMVDPETLRRAVNSLVGEWDGVWHSHPLGEAYPSTEDLNWHPRGLALYIVVAEAVYEYDDRGSLVGVHRV